jgi:GTPase SAR1 family protein
VGRTGGVLIIILEGPDGSGKTTLARRLCEDLTLEYHHEGVPPAEVPPLVHYGRVLEGWRGRNVVLDRLALGERVYGPPIRGRDRLGDDGWRVFRRLLIATGARQVICLPPLDLCFERWRAHEKPELFRDPATFYRTYAAYGYYIASNADQLVYDHVRVSYDTLKYELVQPRPLIEAPGVIGDPHALVSLVGDIVSNTTGLDLPFFNNGGCSRYLTDALDLAGVLESDVLWLNSRRADETENRLPRLNARGQSLRIVALGERAARVCEHQRFERVQRVPHPQYWKRFHRHDLDGYAALLKEACGVS